MEILHLPHNATSSIQPLDQGIIKVFKSYFNSKKLTDILEKVEAGENLFQVYKNLTLKDAIIYLYFAWQQISKTTIQNCFKHAGWFKKENQAKNAVGDDIVKVELYDEFVAKTMILDPIKEKDFMSIEYNETIALLSDESLDKESSEEEVLQSAEQSQIKIISVNECYNALHIIKEYFEQDGKFSFEGTIGIHEISNALKRKRIEKTLDSWIKKINFVFFTFCNSPKFL